MKRDLRDILAVLLTMSVWVCGCNDSDPPETGSDSVTPEQVLGTNEDSKPEDGIPFELNRESEELYGGWLLYAQDETTEVPLGVMDVALLPETDPKQYQVQFMDFDEKDGTLKPAEWIVKTNQIEVSFLQGQQVLIFQGSLQDGSVNGNLIGGKRMCVPARLVRPKEQALQEMPKPHLVEGIHDFTEVMDAGAEWDSLVRFIEEHPGSPVIPNAIYTLAMQAGPRQISTEKLEELFGLIDQSTSMWGERLQDFVRLNALLQLSSDYRNPELIEEMFASLEGKFEEPVWKAHAEFFMETLQKDVELCNLVDAIRQADGNDRNEIIEQLQQKLEENRFNVKLLVATAETLADVSDKQSAIEWYQKLVAVPGMEERYRAIYERFANEMQRPSSRLAELWKEVHGSEDGLQESLEREFEVLLSSYQVPEIELPDPNGKQVLIELFTGTACPPCIAPDLAFTVVRDRLPQDRVILLQYHVHVPAIDPLTCQESQARYGYYNPSGVPTAIVNGRVHENLAGDASAVPGVLQLLVDEVVEELSAQATMQIDAKVTPAADGTSTFEATVKADEISDRWRLHAALAESEVRYRGYNGVPVHNMVVRKLFTPSQGQEPAGDSLTIQGSIDPAAIRKDLKKQMDVLRERREIQFADGPLDLDDLVLVVFVQDVQNRRVRQVVSVPVPSASGATSVPE